MSLLALVTRALDLERFHGRGWTEAAAFVLRMLPAPLVAVAIAGMAGAALGLTALVAFLATVAVLLNFGRGEASHRFGVANAVTLVRLNLTAFLLAVVMKAHWLGLAAAGGLIWVVFAVASIALLLDGVDGWLARRRHEASEFGERFDMVTDSAFTIITTLCLVTFGLVGAWILMIGLLRPAFVVAGRLWPTLAAPLPESRGRKMACAGSLTCLVAALAPPLATLAPALALVALLQLVWSFGRDLRYLMHQQATP